MLEIEKKYIIYTLPENYDNYKKSHIIQFYLNESPVLRLRKIDNRYVFTYKSKGLISRDEVEFEINSDLFYNLLQHSDAIINKTRYFIPYKNYTIELDVFHDKLEGLKLAEVEFDTLDDAKNFIPPLWFEEDVTSSEKYQNVNLIKKGYHE